MRTNFEKELKFRISNFKFQFFTMAFLGERGLLSRKRLWGNHPRAGFFGFFVLSILPEIAETKNDRAAPAGRPFLNGYARTPPGRTYH
jgi:hypothetical protein